MPDLNAILAQRHSIQSIVASFVGAGEKGMLFYDDDSLHIKMGIAQDSDHSGFVKRSAPGLSRWIKAEIKIFGSAFRVNVVPGDIVVWKFNGRTDQHGQNVRNEFHFPLVYYRLHRFARRDLGFGGFCRDTSNEITTSVVGFPAAVIVPLMIPLFIATSAPCACAASKSGISAHSRTCRRVIFLLLVLDLRQNPHFESRRLSPRSIFLGYLKSRATLSADSSRRECH